jgi:Ca2+-transporting ATPase
MQRKPRASDEKVLPNRLLVWLAVVGALQGVLTLLAIWWAESPHGVAFARTMGLTAFALMHVAFAFATKDEHRTVFDRDTLKDKPLLVSGALSIAAIILATTFGPFQRLLETTELELEQWLLCIGGALVVLAVAEIRKLVVRQPIDEGAAASGDAELVGGPALVAAS